MQHLGKTVHRVLQHGVENSSRDPLLSERSGGVESPKRRIRLHLPYLLGVVRQMIRVRQKYICHGFLDRFTNTPLRGTNMHSRVVWEVPGRLRAIGERRTAQRLLPAKVPRGKSIDSKTAASVSAT